MIPILPTPQNLSEWDFTDFTDFTDGDTEMTMTKEIDTGLHAIARALHLLGNADASTPMGGLEAHGAAILEAANRIAVALESVADAIELIADRPDSTTRKGGPRHADS